MAPQTPRPLDPKDQETIQDQDAKTVDAALSPLDVLRRDGWIKGESHNERGAHCLMGALEVLGLDDGQLTVAEMTKGPLLLVVQRPSRHDVR